MAMGGQQHLATGDLALERLEQVTVQQSEQITRGPHTLARRRARLCARRVRQLEVERLHDRMRRVQRRLERYEPALLARDQRRAPALAAREVLEQDLPLAQDAGELRDALDRAARARHA